MRIAHISDHHGDMENLQIFGDYITSSDSIDLIVSTGDDNRISFVRGDKEKFNRIEKEYRTCLSEISRLTSKIGNSPVFRPAILDSLHRKSKELEAELTETILSQYSKAKQIFEALPQRKIMIPGNWDPDCWNEIFGNWSLNQKAEVINGLVFAGYGSGEYAMHNFTERIDYNEDAMHDFFHKVNPDVIITHTPPRKITDLGNLSENLLGSGMLRSYIFEKNPRLILSGHSHRLETEKASNKTVISNAGNLGAADYPGEPHGSFSIIEIQNSKIIIEHMLIENGQVRKTTPAEIKKILQREIKYTRMRRL
jgi:Icc-related predicted phosphoesterase